MELIKITRIYLMKTIFVSISTMNFCIFSHGVNSYIKKHLLSMMRTLTYTPQLKNCWVMRKFFEVSAFLSASCSSLLLGLVGGRGGGGGGENNSEFFKFLGKQCIPALHFLSFCIGVT